MDAPSRPMSEPRIAEAHALATAGRYDEAAELCRVILDAQPRHARAWMLLGAILLRQGDVERSFAASARAVEFDPQLPLAHCNLGAAYAERLELAEAHACYDRALALDPNHALTHVNRAIAWLLAGDSARGWPEYEWRWQLADLFRRPVPHAELRWDGRLVAGQTLLVYAEQGSGDALQMVRFLPQIRAAGMRVVVRCGQPLVRLLRGSALADDVSPDGTELPPFDRHASLMSVPGLVGATLDTIPRDVPYVRPDARLLERWAGRLAPEHGFKVGLCWQGNPHHQRDAERSIHPTLLAPLAAVPGVRWVSLQRAHGSVVDLPFEALDLAPLLHDFADTAAAILHLDLVVTVDTSVAHLAGALGRPVWILLPFAPDWRWLLERADSPWYPTARLFRQPARGDWPWVTAQVVRALGKLK